MASCVASETPSFAGQIDVDKDRVGSQLGAKTQTCLALRGRTDHLYLTGLVEQFRQVPGSQGLIFDNNSSEPDPHEKKCYLDASSLTSEVRALGDSKLS
jgi:hypothetical protein